MTAEINADGLAVRYGINEAVQTNIGSYTNFGPVHQLEILVDYSELPAVADGQVILDDAFAIPAGALIEEVEILPATTDFDSTADGSLFNLGVINQDRTSNALTDGLIDDATETEVNTGGTNTAGWVGALVGTVTAYNYLFTWEVNGEAATAGAWSVRVRWSVPPKNSDTLAWSKS